MKESIEKVKETTESLAAKEEKLDDEINDTCDQLVIEDHTDRDDCDENLDDEINGTRRLKSIIPPPRRQHDDHQLHRGDDHLVLDFDDHMGIIIMIMMIMVAKVAMIEERRTHLLNQLHFRASTKREKLGESSSPLIGIIISIFISLN